MRWRSHKSCHKAVCCRGKWQVSEKFCLNWTRHRPLELRFHQNKKGNPSSWWCRSNRRLWMDKNRVKTEENRNINYDFFAKKKSNRWSNWRAHKDRRRELSMCFLETNRIGLILRGRINGLGIRNAENLLLHAPSLLQNSSGGRWILRKKKKTIKNGRTNEKIMPFNQTRKDQIINYKDPDFNSQGGQEPRRFRWNSFDSPSGFNKDRKIPPSQVLSQLKLKTSTGSRNVKRQEEVEGSERTDN